MSESDGKAQKGCTMGELCANNHGGCLMSELWRRGMERFQNDDFHTKKSSSPNHQGLFKSQTLKHAHALFGITTPGRMFAKAQLRSIQHSAWPRISYTRHEPFSPLLWSNSKATVPQLPQL